MESSFDTEQYLLPLEALLFPLLPRRLGELRLFDIKERGTGLVKPMLLLPVSLPPEETVIVTGEEAGEEAVFTIFTMSFASQKRGEKRKKNPQILKEYPEEKN